MLVVPVPCLFDNYAYLIGCETTRKCMVVDPAEYYPVYIAADSHKLQIAGVLCTHHHRDHTDGVEDLLADDPGLPVYGHRSDNGRIKGLNRLLDDGDRLSIGELQISVHHTPGHTRGSVVYHVEDSLFTGDTLFGGGCGRLFEGTAEEMFHSLERIMKIFSPETKVYPGHEYTRANLQFARTLEPNNPDLLARIESLLEGKPQDVSTLLLEQQTNPFVRCSAGEEIRKSLSVAGVHVESDPVALFAAVRRLRDGY